MHATKFQSVVAPNGLIAMLHEPCKGRKQEVGYSQIVD